MKINKIILIFNLIIYIFFLDVKKIIFLPILFMILMFLVDTVLFDTLFTTIGSTTKRIKCYNNNNGIINISQINLKWRRFPFRINVDGESGYF